MIKKRSKTQHEQPEDLHSGTAIIQVGNNKGMDKVLKRPCKGFLFTLPYVTYNLVVEIVGRGLTSWTSPNAPRPIVLITSKSLPFTRLVFTKSTGFSSESINRSMNQCFN